MQRRVRYRHGSHCMAGFKGFRRFRGERLTAATRLRVMAACGGRLYRKGQRPYGPEGVVSPLRGDEYEDSVTGFVLVSPVLHDKELDPPSPGRGWRRRRRRIGASLEKRFRGFRRFKGFRGWWYRCFAAMNMKTALRDFPPGTVILSLRRRISVHAAFESNQ